MADASDIAQVRRNTNELDDTNGYTDVVIGGYIDVEGVAGASAHIWEEKSARWSELVDVSEAGASHAFSDLSKNARAFAEYWAEIQAEIDVPLEGRPKVRKIVRQ